MARVIICDRCGGLTEERRAGHVSHSPSPEATVRDYGMCPTCSRELHDFMNPDHRQTPALVPAFNPDIEPEPEPETTPAGTSRRALNEHFAEDDTYEPLNPDYGDKP